MLFGKKRSLYGRIVFLVLVLVPLILWLQGVDLKTITASPSALIKALGKACAFIGLAAYCLQPILSLRHKLIEKLFGGLDSVYLLHKQAGKTSYFFILAHPILLATGGLAGGKNLLTIWNWASLSVLLGIFSFLALTTITVLTIYAHLKHQKWVIVHRLFGWLLPALFAHALLARAQIIQQPALYGYMLVLVLAGFWAFLCRSVFVTFIRKYQYEVAEVNTVTPTVTELVLKPVGVPLSYNPGQFAYLSLLSPVVDHEAHPFSFTTANNGPYVRFAIKELGDYTANVKKVRPGTPALLEGPFGNFSYHNSKRPGQVWIAGGVGITPFLSMARSLRPGAKQHIHLFYAADKLQDAAFLRELIAIRKTIPDNFSFTLVNREWSGFVTIDILKRIIKDFTTDDYFICGPPMMMKKLKTDLVASGTRRSSIFTEEFSVL